MTSQGTNEQQPQPAPWKKDLLHCLSTNSNPVDKNHPEDTGFRVFYDALNTFLNQTEEEANADAPFVEKVFQLLDQFKGWDYDCLLDVGVPNLIESDQREHHDEDSDEESDEMELEEVRLPLLTRFLKHPPKHAKSVELWPRYSSGYTNIPSQMNIHGCIEYLRVYEEHYGRNPGLRGQKSIEEFLACTRNISQVNLDIEGGIWRKGDATCLIPFTSTTKYLQLREVNYDGAYGTLFHPDTKFPRLESLSICLMDCSDISNARAFWDSWFSRVQKTLKTLNICMQAMGTGMPKPVHIHVGEFFSIMCLEASKPGRCLPLEKLSIDAHVGLSLFNLEILARSPIASTLKEIEIEKISIVPALATTFLAFQALERASFALMFHWATEGEIRDYNGFLRQYLASCPKTLKNLSLSEITVDEDVGRLIPLENLESLTVKRSELFQSGSSFVVNLLGGASRHLNIRLETLVLDERTLAPRTITQIIRGLPTLRRLSIQIETCKSSQLDMIVRALESVTNIVSFSMYCHAELNMHMDPNFDKKAFDKFMNRCNDHCLKNRLERALSWSTGTAPISFYGHVLQHIDSASGPYGVYTTLKRGKVLSDLGLG